MRRRCLIFDLSVGPCDLAHLADAQGFRQVPLLDQVAQHLFAGSAKYAVAFVGGQIAFKPFHVRDDAVERGAGPPHRLVPLEGAQLAEAGHAPFDNELGHGHCIPHPIGGVRSDEPQRLGQGCGARPCQLALSTEEGGYDESLGFVVGGVGSTGGSATS